MLGELMATEDRVPAVLFLGAWLVVCLLFIAWADGLQADDTTDDDD